MPSTQRLLHQTACFLLVRHLSKRHIDPFDGLNQREPVTMDQYECVKKLGSGNFGVTLLMRHKETGESVAVKQLPRGNKINKNVYREVLNHRKLSHPNVIGFKAVYLDDEHLNIVMEYASGERLRGKCH